MELFKINKGAADISAEAADNIIVTTIRLLHKSMNLLDIEPNNKSAIFNIHHSFRQDINQCVDIIKYNTNISKTRLNELKEAFNNCEQRRISYCLKHKDR